MRSKKGMLRLACCTAAIGALTGSFEAHAGATANENGVTSGDEIVISARRRNEALQDVPIAVTVLTSEEIAKSGVQGVGDIANLTPNVSFDNALNLGTNFLTIRGQGQSQYAPPPAAIVVDGVLTISPLQFNVDEFDLQQVEVLKGPQGAIYGRNAIAGAVNITSRKPGDTFEARMLAGYGRGEEWRAKASISGPVIPGLLSVLAGVSFTDRRGQVENVTTGAYSDKMKDLTGRLRAIVTPTDAVEIDVKYTYSDAKGRDPAYITSRSGDPSMSSDPLDANREGRNPRTLHDLSGKLSVESGFGTATLTLAYVHVSENVEADFDFSPLDIFAVKQKQSESGFSQELRFTSTDDGPLRWLVGGYHVRSKRRIGADIFVDPFYFGLTPEPTQADFLISQSNDLNRYETWSGFANVEYDILPNLEAAVAIRYDDDDLTQHPGAGGTRRAGFSKWQPKGTLTFKPIPEWMLYSSVGKGFRSGDFNASGSSFGNPVIAAESAINYEIGTKARLLDGRAILDAAVFRTDLDNGQFKLFDAVGATNVGINIDKTRIEGFEIAGAFRLTEGFTLSASLGYADPKIRGFTPPPGFGGSTAEYIGNRPPRISRYTANVGLDIDIPVSDDLNLYVRPEFRHTSGFYWDLENDYRRPSANLVNLRAGLSDADGSWTVTGWVKNALSEKVTGEYQPFTNSGHPLGIDVYYPAVGATYGIELTYSF